MIRKFYLENDNGETFYFKNSSGVLLSNISGLGFSYQTSYLKYDHTYELVKKDKQLENISADLIFLDGYDSYDKLVTYLSRQSENLKFYYITSDTKFLFVDVVTLTKGEIKDGHLRSTLELNKKTYLIRERQILINQSELTDGKIYPYKYPYEYQASSAGITRFEVVGVTKAATVLEIIGNVVNPEIKVFRANQLLTQLRLNITQNKAHLKISSIPNDQFMVSIEEGKEVDIYHLQDFDKDNFLLLDMGSLTVEFISGSGNDTICRLLIYEYHLG